MLCPNLRRQKQFPGPYIPCNLTHSHFMLARTEVINGLDGFSWFGFFSAKSETTEFIFITVFHLVIAKSFIPAFLLFKSSFFTF